MSLIDDVSTYRLTYDDGSDPLEFGSHAEAMEHVDARRRATLAKRALRAIWDAGLVLTPAAPTDAMITAGDLELDNEDMQGAEDVYREMIAAGAVKP